MTFIERKSIINSVIKSVMKVSFPHMTPAYLSRRLQDELITFSQHLATFQIRTNKMNSTNTTSTDFAIDDTNLTIGEKVVMIFLWVIIEVVGNGLLFGLIQFDRVGEDPLKRRIIDQVNCASYSFWKYLNL